MALEGARIVGMATTAETQAVVRGNPSTTSGTVGAPPSAIITREGERVLRAELGRVRRELEGDMADRLRKARAFGAPAGNDDYLQIQEEEIILAARAARLDELLERTRVIDSGSLDGRAAVGTIVEVKDTDGGELMVQELVGGHEAPRVNAASAASPVGQALIGRKTGEIVVVHLPKRGESTPRNRPRAAHGASTSPDGPSCGQEKGAAMFKNVIVGVDGGTSGRDAVALGRQLLDPQGQLTLVHVHLETTAVIVHEFDSAARDEAQRLLEGEREAAGGEAEVASVGGTSVAVGLHRYAEDHAADLLVVGPCHRGVVGRVLAGDNTRDSLQCAPCAAAMPPRGYAATPSAIEIIGVGYDASAESNVALAGARELAGGGDIEIHALVVVAALRFDGSRLAPLNSVMGTDPRLNEMLRRLGELDHVTARAAYGLTIEELGSFGEEVDLLLLGSRNEEPPGRLVLDRMSRRLTRSAKCPLLILPPPAADPELDHRQMGRPAAREF